MRTVEPALQRGAPALVAYRGLRVLSRVMTKLYWRLEIVGAERVPVSGAYVIAPIHRSNLDFLLAGLPIERPIRWMAKSTLFTDGPVERFLHAMGAFPVVRDTADFSAIRTCEALLAAGEPVVVFPEGRRKEGDAVAPLYDGAAFMAARGRVPLLPVGIGGSDLAMPIGSKAILPRKVVVVVGEPIYPDVELQGHIPRSTITALTAELKHRIQEVYDESRRIAG